MSLNLVALRSFRWFRGVGRPISLQPPRRQLSPLPPTERSQPLGWIAQTAGSWRPVSRPPRPPRATPIPTPPHWAVPRSWPGSSRGYSRRPECESPPTAHRRIAAWPGRPRNPPMMPCSHLPVPPAIVPETFTAGSRGFQVAPLFFLETKTQRGLPTDQKNQLFVGRRGRQCEHWKACVDVAGIGKNGGLVPEFDRPGLGQLAKMETRLGAAGCRGHQQSPPKTPAVVRGEFAVLAQVERAGSPVEILEIECVLIAAGLGGDQGLRQRPGRKRGRELRPAKQNVGIPTDVNIQTCHVPVIADLHGQLDLGPVRRRPAVDDAKILPGRGDWA